jgi:hypothetical protein
LLLANDLPQIDTRDLQHDHQARQSTANPVVTRACVRACACACVVVCECIHGLHVCDMQRACACTHARALSCCCCRIRRRGGSISWRGRGALMRTAADFTAGEPQHSSTAGTCGRIGAECRPKDCVLPSMARASFSAHAKETGRTCGDATIAADTRDTV